MSSWIRMTGQTPEAYLELTQRKIASLTGELVTVYEELALLYSLVAQLGQLVDENKIATVAMREAMEVLGGDCGWAVLWEPARVPPDCRFAIGAGAVDLINRNVLAALRDRGKQQLLSHDLPAEWNLDDGDVPGKMLACALPGTHALLGYLCLGRRGHNRIFTAADQKLLYAIAAVTGVTLENLRLQHSELENQRLASELELARRIQVSLLPHEFRCCPCLDSSGVSLPCHEIGGDTFDLIPMGPDLCLLAIADVSGKGPAAALQAAMLQGILHAASRHTSDLGALMQITNNCIRQRCADSSFVSAFLATLDSSGRLLYSNAGHNPPLLIQDGCPVTELKEGGPVFGVIETRHYPVGSTQMRPGGLLLMYTDGIIDCENSAGDSFGQAALLDWAARQTGRAPVEITAELIDILKKFSSGVLPVDDQTVLVVRFIGT